VQACTLVASCCGSPELPQDTIALVEETLERTQDSELCVGLLNFLWLVLHKQGFTRISLEIVLKRVFSFDERVTFAAVVVLARLVFDKSAVFGDQEIPSNNGNLYLRLLQRLSQTLYIIPGFPEVLHTIADPRDDVWTEPTSKAVAICVNLFSGRQPPTFVDKMKNDEDFELFLISGKMRSIDPNHAVVAKLLLDLEHDDERFVQTSTLWRAVRIAKVSHEVARVISQGIINCFSRFAQKRTVPNWFVCELLDALLFALQVSKDVNILEKVNNLLLTRNDQSLIDLNVWKCILKIAVACCALFKSLRGSPFDALVSILTRSVPYSVTNAFCNEAILFILVTISEPEFHEIIKSSSFGASFLQRTISSKSPSRLEWRLARGCFQRNLLSPSDCFELYQKALLLIEQPPGKVAQEEAVAFLTAMIGATSSDKELTNPIMDALSADDDSFFNQTPQSFLPLLGAVAQTRGKELSYILIHNNRWKWLLSENKKIPINLAVGLIAQCLDSDPRLLPYLSHQGLFEAIASNENICSNALIKILLAVRNSDASLLHHFDACIAWIQSAGFSQFILDSINLCHADLVLDFVIVSSEILLSTQNKMAGGACVINALLSSAKSPLLCMKGCAALTQFLRVPGALDGMVADFSEILDILKFHETICVPDRVDPAASKATQLFFAQMKVIASFAAAACSHDGVAQAYSDWFCNIWKRGVIILHSKQTSPFPLLSELVCGLLEVLAVADLGQVCWGAPISHVLSFVTRSSEHLVLANVPVKLFCLCLSVAESASAILVRKAVAARILSSLISQHAVIHGKHIPKDQSALAKAGAVIHLSASLVGCRLCASEILKSLDGWLEARQVLDKEVLVRLVASVVLAGGYCRGSIQSNSGAILFLGEMAAADSGGLAQKSLEILSCGKSVLVA
jgi:hypothetical protein